MPAVEPARREAVARLWGRAADAEEGVLPLAESFFRWNPAPGAYDDARAKLAAIIVAAQRKTRE